MSTTLKLYNFGNSAGTTTITSIMDGDTYSWRLDDSLDSGVIIFTSNDLNPVEPFTIATIQMDDNTTEKMWVAEDSVTMLSKVGTVKTYQHTLKLVELTKILEKLVITGLCLTPSNKSSGTYMYSSLYAEYLRALDVINLQSPYIKLETGTSSNFSPLYYAEEETFVFSNSTAREILDEIFSAIDSRVVVDEVAYNNSTHVITLKLGFIKMEEGSEVVLSNNTHHKVISESSGNSVEAYAGEIYSSIEGAMCKNEISFQDTFKSNDALATSSNRVMSLPYAIQYPTRFRLKSTTAKITVTGTYYVSGDSSAHTITRDIITINGNSTRDFFDALDYFVDYEYWQVLSLVNQQKTLYYQRGATEVDVSRTYKSLIVTKSVFQTLFNELLTQFYTDNYQAIWNYIANEIGAGVSTQLSSITLSSKTAGDIDDVVFDISYIGEVDGLTTSSKVEDRTWFERDLKVVDNQRTNIVDLTRYGRNLEGKIARLGNDLFYIDCDVDSYANILPLLTKINEYSAIIYQVDISRHTDSDTWYEVRYYLSKNFNNINERIALKREKRIYAIPPKGYQVILPDRETIAIGNYSYTGDGVQQDLASTDYTAYQIAKALTGTAGQISNATVQVNIATDQSQNLKDFVLPVACYGSGNTINMIAKFYDNASAGLSIDTSSYGGINWLGGKKVSYNKYTNDYGWAKNPTIEWGHFTNDRTEAGVQVQPVRAKTGNNYDEAFTKIFGSSFTIDKDPSEALCFQKIIRLVPASSNVIIGCFADYNCLYTDIGDMYVYYQTTNRDAYQPGDRKVRYSQADGDEKVQATPTLYVGLYTVYIRVASLDNVNKYNLALGDADGNMFAAVNGLSSTKTLFRIAKKETRG